MSNSRGKEEAARRTLELYTAIRDRRVPDMLALLHPEVVCTPLVRPGLSVYEGHEAMIKLVGDVHNQHGDYRVEIDEITQDADPQGVVTVTVQARILPEPGCGRPATVPVATVYTVRDGMIIAIESTPGANPATDSTSTANPAPDSASTAASTHPPARPGTPAPGTSP
jgi:ketosteroid isomerase-like protein